MWQVLGAKTTKILGITLILCGAMMMILQIACTAINGEMGYYLFHRAGTGIWCGLLILISGVVGCCAAVQKTSALVITFLVLNVLGVTVFSPVMIGVTGGELDENNDKFCEIETYWVDHRNRTRIEDCRFYYALLIMTILLLLDALVSVWGIVTNSSAIIAAKACGCCDDSPSETQTPIVIYLPVGQNPENAVESPQPQANATQATSQPTPNDCNQGSSLGPPPYKA